MTSTVLLTLGRLPKALDLARGFHAAGARVLVADPFAWHPLRTSRAVAASVRVPAPNDGPAAYRAALLALIARERVDLVVPVSEEALHVAPIRDALPPGARLLGPDFETLAALHDKRRFIQSAVALGLSVPETFPLGTQEAATLAARAEVVVKPILTCAGIGMTRHGVGARLPDAEGGPPRLVQRAIDGRHLSSFAYVEAGRPRINLVYEGTVFSGTVAVAFRRVEMPAAVADWISHFLAAHPITGFIAFDFILDAAGTPYAIECNPRVTSGVHFVDAEALARAILAPGDPLPLPLGKHAVMQQVLPTLTETQAALFDPPRLRRHLQTLFSARSVMWRRDDPWPELLMTFSSHEILRRTIFGRMSFGEAATRDIAWFG